MQHISPVAGTVFLWGKQDGKYLSTEFQRSNNFCNSKLYNDGVRDDDNEFMDLWSFIVGKFFRCAGANFYNGIFAGFLFCWAIGDAICK